MARIWDTFMFRDEFGMLEMRAEECSGADVTHVAVEAPWTHRAVPKPLELDRWATSGGWFPGDLVVVTDDWDPDRQAPWVNEHHQRNKAWWAYINEHADADDWVLIVDVDEIPSAGLLRWLQGPDAAVVVSVPMRTMLFAVDWEVARDVPPACVAARVWWLRGQAAGGGYLAEVRDGRGRYPEFPGHGGWHFSWCGGPAAQAEKLDTATCHTEILHTAEADLIRSGARWATDQNGGGLPVRAVDVDGTWPAYITERRCPPEWFRPRTQASRRVPDGYFLNRVTGD